MPIYLDIFTLIVNKSAVTEKYHGGLEQFRQDFEFEGSEINYEDGQLFALGQMDPDGFDLAHLMSQGLHYDEKRQFSYDFTILYRYGGDDYWEVPWLENNTVFAWHKDAHPKELARVKEICNMTMDVIGDYFDEGLRVLDTVWLHDETPHNMS
ncbi:MAG: hypothetical protein WAT79_06600 [Saprospiraceae bacterium]